MIKRNVARTVMVGIAASAAVGLAASAFAAAPLTYKITAGTHTSGTIAYTAATAKGTTSSPAIVFTDVTHNQKMGCASGTAAGSMKLGPAVAAAGAGRIAKTGWVGCSGPGGIALVPHQPATSIWTINGVARPVNGVTKVFIGNVTANVTSQVGCQFTVVGQADGTYNNTTGKLVLAPRADAHKLTIKNASGCFSLITNGDVVTFRGAYTVKTAAGKILIR